MAGDELLTPPYANLTREQADCLIATGFLRQAPDGTADSVADAELARNDVVAGTIKITVALASTPPKSRVITVKVNPNSQLNQSGCTPT